MKKTCSLKLIFKLSSSVKNKGFVNHKQSQKKIKYLSQDDESNNNSNKMFLKLKKKLSMSAYIVPKYLNLNKHLGEHMKV